MDDIVLLLADDNIDHSVIPVISEMGDMMLLLASLLWEMLLLASLLLLMRLGLLLREVSPPSSVEAEGVAFELLLDDDVAVAVAVALRTGCCCCCCC